MRRLRTFGTLAPDNDAPTAGLLDTQPRARIKRRKLKVNARTASPQEREALWPKLVAHYPDFATYATWWTERVIPVVILEPIA
ncbi:MAG: nitroreductase family deazaflavin-dependent oxidoreductase [Deltaproteobacteria bacterium]|nr:nitroreductase family deazaflavin-dependent oxidoreductase [Deltaproteobacteria bacterium]